MHFGGYKIHSVRSTYQRGVCLIKNRAPHGQQLNIGPSIEFVSHFSAVSKFYKFYYFKKHPMDALMMR